MSTPHAPKHGRGEVPDRETLSDALAELERTDPEVAAARQALDDLPEQFARYNRHMAARKQVGKREAKP